MLPRSALEYGRHDFGGSSESRKADITYCYIRQLKKYSVDGFLSTPRIY